MEIEEALAAVSDADARDRTERAHRLVELMRLIEASNAAFSNQAAEWLFEDVKATWIYGYFAATIVTSHSFCRRQLAGVLLMRSDDPELPHTIDSLEDLAARGEEHGVIDLDLRAKLVELSASAEAFTTVDLHVDHQRLERRLEETALLNGDEHPLLIDALAALTCCAALLRDR